MDLEKIVHELTVAVPGREGDVRVLGLVVGCEGFFWGVCSVTVVVVICVVVVVVAVENKVVVVAVAVVVVGVRV